MLDFNYQKDIDKFKSNIAKYDYSLYGLLNPSNIKSFFIINKNKNNLRFIYVNENAEINNNHISISNYVIGSFDSNGNIFSAIKSDFNKRSCIIKNEELALYLKMFNDAFKKYDMININKLAKNQLQFGFKIRTYENIVNFNEYLKLFRLKYKLDSSQTSSYIAGIINKYNCIDRFVEFNNNTATLANFNTFYNNASIEANMNTSSINKENMKILKYIDILIMPVANMLYHTTNVFNSKNINDYIIEYININLLNYNL